MVDHAPSTPVPPSSYAAASRQLVDLGYHVIPLIPADADHNARGKAPGHVRSGRWLAMSEWQRFKDRAPSEFERRVWSGYECANAGIVLGTNVSRDHQLIAIDIDTIDPDAFEDIIRCLPATPMRKRGLKGETRFYRAPQTIKSRGYDDSRSGARTRLIDVLTGHETKQTVVPPSVHPDSRQAYVWLEGPVPADELPVFDEDALAVLVETLEVHGYQAEQARPERRAPGEVDYDDNMWTEVKVAAMANLAAWVPDLNLYRCQAVRGGGYKAVATWRSSSTGRPVEVRKRNLSITSEGIRDFGADEGYTPIDLVMRALDYDQPAATAWLQERLGLTPQTVFEPSGNVTVAPEPEPERIQPPEELPAHLTRVPGLVGDLAGWICDMARRPQPGLALGAALTVVGTLAGRKYSTPTESGTHLYILGIARSAAGKDHGLAMVQRLLDAAGFPQYIGNNSFMSQQALYNTVAMEPIRLCPMDEFGSFIRRINARGASGHEAEINSVLRQLWGSSFKLMPVPSWATRSSTPIQSPAFSIFAASTPEEFFAALTGADLINGFLNRFLLISTRVRPPERDPKVSGAPPAKLVYGMKKVQIRDPLVAASAKDPIVIVPWDSPAAKQVYADFGRYIEDERESDGAAVGRVVEMAQRLATIRAIGINPDAPRLTVADMEWGRDLAMWSIDRMIAEVGAYVAETDHQANAQAVLRAIRGWKGQGPMPHQKLVVAMQHKLKARDLAEVIESLVQSGEVKRENGPPPPSGGRASTWYST